MLKPLLILIGAQLAGEFVVALFQLRFPPPIMGMLLLFAGLYLIRRVPAELESLASKLFPYIPLLLIPISVGVLQYTHLVGNQLLGISLAIVISTVVGVISCGLVMKWLLKK